MKTTYTLEEKREFLEQVNIMLVAMETIDAMDLQIINKVGLKAYPFAESFDELVIKVQNWAFAIEDHGHTQVSKSKKTCPKSKN